MRSGGLRRLAWLAALTVSCPLAGQAGAGHSGTRPHLERVPCWFEVPPQRAAECAWFYPGDRVQGQAVRLPVVRIPGAGDAGAYGAILHIPGGPGYPAGLDQAGMRQWWRWRDTTRWPQDLVLFDPRGTGLSQPTVDCPEIRRSDRASLDRALTVEAELRQLADAARSCYRRLGRDVASRFTGERQVRDIGTLLGVLGGDDWNLWAVSYGTRLAMQVMRDYPQHLRGAVLDSAFPPEVNGFLARPAQFDRALREIEADCAERSECARAHPHLGTRIQALLERAGRHPFELAYLRHLGMEPITLTVTDYRLLWMLFFDSYRSHYDRNTASEVDRAAAGEVSALEPMARRLVTALLDPDFSQAVYYTASCADDWPGVTRRAYREALSRHPRVAPYLRLDRTYSVCRFWDVPKPPARYSRPLTSAVPALFLHGEHDAATLPEWAAAAAERMPNAYFVLFKGSGHAVTFSNQCAMSSARTFLQAPRDWRVPDCLARQRLRSPRRE